MQIELFKHQLEFMKSQCTHTAIVGGFGCFLNGQNIITEKNNLCEIQNVKTGDFVESFNLKTKEVELKKVLNTFKYSTDCYFKIKMKDGLEINVTKNHKFLFKNSWLSIEEILSYK